MAKKTVAILQSGESKNYTKVVKMVKSDKGGYPFQEEMVAKDKVNDFFNK